MTKVIAALVVVGLMTVSAMGQTFAKVRVPFAFIMGDAKLPAGTYEIAALGANTTRFRNTEKPNIVAVANLIHLSRGNGNTVADKASVVFTRYETDYYLSEIWPAGELIGRGLVKSEHEIQLAKRVQPVRIESVAASQP